MSGGRPRPRASTPSPAHTHSRRAQSDLRGTGSATVSDADIAEAAWRWYVKSGPSLGPRGARSKAASTALLRATQSLSPPRQRPTGAPDSGGAATVAHGDTTSSAAPGVGGTHAANEAAADTASDMAAADGTLPSAAAAAVARARLRLSDLRSYASTGSVHGRTPATAADAGFSTPPPRRATAGRLARQRPWSAHAGAGGGTRRASPPSGRSFGAHAARSAASPGTPNLAAAYEADIASLVRESEASAASRVGQEAELASARAKMAAQQDTIMRLTSELTHEHRLVEDLMSRNADAPAGGPLTGSRRKAPRAAGGKRAASARLTQQPRRGTAVLTHQLEQKHNTIIQLTSDNQRLHQRVRDQEAHAARVSAERDAAEEALAACRAREEAAARLREEHTALEAKYGEVCALVQELVSDKEALLNEKQALTGRLEACQRENARLKGRVHALDTALAEGSNRAADAVSRALDASQSVVRAKEDLDSMRRRAMDAEARLESTKQVHERAIRLLNQSHVVEFEQSNAQIAQLIDQLRRVSLAVASGDALPPIHLPASPPTGSHRMNLSDIGATPATAASGRTSASRLASILSPDARSRLTAADVGSPVTDTVIALSEEGVRLAGTVRQQAHEVGQLRASLTEEQNRSTRAKDLLEQSVSALQASLRTANDDKRKVEMEWQADRAAWKRHQSALEKEATHMVGQIRQLKAEKQQIQLRLDETQQKMADFRAKQTRVEGELKNFAGMMSSANTEVSALELQLEEAKSDAAHLRAQLRRATEVNDEARARESGRRAETQRASAEAAGVAVLRQDLRRVQQELASKDREVQLVKQQLAEANNRAQEHRAEVARLELALTSAEAKERTLTTQLRDYEKQTRHNSSAFEGQVQRLTHDARSTVANAQSEVSEARLEASGVRRELQVVAAEKGHLQAEVSRLKSELRSAHERLHSEEKARLSLISELDATRSSAASLRASQHRLHPLPHIPAPSVSSLQLERQLQASRSDVASLRAQLDEEREHSNGISVVNMQLKAREQQLSTLIDTLRSKVTAQDDVVKKLERECRGLRSQGSHMSSALSGLRAQHAALVAESKRLLSIATSQPSGDAQQLHTELMGHRVLVDKLSARNAALVQQVKQLGGTVFGSP